MELKIKASDDTPEVYFSKTENIFLMEGNSLPEEVTEFYNPILEALDKYLAAPNSESEFCFKLFYFNSASSKMIYTILEKLDKAFSEGANIVIKWMYEADDDDMLEAGQSMKEYLKIPMEFEAFFDAEA